MNYTEIKGVVELHALYDPKEFIAKNTCFAFLGGNWFIKDKDEERIHFSSTADGITDENVTGFLSFLQPYTKSGEFDLIGKDAHAYKYEFANGKWVYFPISVHGKIYVKKETTEERITTALSRVGIDMKRPALPYAAALGRTYIINDHNEDLPESLPVNTGNYSKADLEKFLTAVEPFVQEADIHCDIGDAYFIITYIDGTWKRIQLNDKPINIIKSVSTDDLIEEIEKRGFIILKHETGLTDFLDDVDVDDLGCTIVDAFYEDDNFATDIGKSVYSIFKDCDTKEKFDTADQMLTAVCGYGIKSLLNRM